MSGAPSVASLAPSALASPALASSALASSASMPSAIVPPALARFLTADAFPLLVLALTAVEALLLVLWHARTGRGPEPSRALPFLGAGAAFLCALHFHRRDDGVAGFALAMTAAFALHLWHLRTLARDARGARPANG